MISGFGYRNRPSGEDLHTGIDFGAPEGTPVLSVLDGLVVRTYDQGTASGYGNLVVIKHANDLYSVYAHLKRIDVRQAQPVIAGQQIGAVGRTAGTRADPRRLFPKKAAHLHFEFITRLSALKGENRDRFRLNPAPVFLELGIIVPERGQLIAAADSPASCTSRQAVRYVPGAPIPPGTLPVPDFPPRGPGALPPGGYFLPPGSPAPLPPAPEPPRREGGGMMAIAALLLLSAAGRN